MSDLSNLTAIVIDHGLFLPIARRLARDFKKVYYWTPEEKAFSTVRDSIGDGFQDIVRTRSLWDVKDECDLVVAPDIGFSGMQKELVAQGMPVWGARAGDILEISRGKFLDALRQTKLLCPEHVVIEGFTNLRDHLRGRTDCWVKISRFRGDWETLHWRSWEEDENTLDWYALKFGPFREKIVFYVFDPIETENEDGCDTWCIDGQFPSLVIHGMEAKDKGYVGTFQRFDDLPEEIRSVNTEFAPILARYGYRSFFSTEVRITPGGDSYFIDPTCRAGSPPSQCMTEMIANYGQVIWGGANGECVEPESAAKFGVQAIVNMKRERYQWGTLKVTDELDRWLKCPNCIMIEDTLCFVPETESRDQDIGWLVGIGDTFGEAIRHLKHNIGLLPDGASCDIAVLSELCDQIESEREAGMKFGSPPVENPQAAMAQT